MFFEGINSLQSFVRLIKSRQNIIIFYKTKAKYRFYVRNDQALVPDIKQGNGNEARDL